MDKLVFQSWWYVEANLDYKLFYFNFVLVVFIFCRPNSLSLCPLILAWLFMATVTYRLWKHCSIYTSDPPVLAIIHWFTISDRSEHKMVFCSAFLKKAKRCGKSCPENISHGRIGQKLVSWTFGGCQCVFILCSREFLGGTTGAFKTGKILNILHNSVLSKIKLWAWTVTSLNVASEC